MYRYDRDLYVKSNNRVELYSQFCENVSRDCKGILFYYMFATLIFN